MKRIYIADDEENIRLLIQSFLINEGYETELFPDGQSLLNRFLLSEPDLIILDIMMPGIDGFNLCALIRQQSQVPMIIVSARDNPLDRVKGITLGSDDYLVKPFLPLELVARVKALFRRQGLSMENARPSHTLVYGDLTISSNSHTISIAGVPFSATPTEYEFLFYMIERCGMAVDKKELLREIWKLPDYDINTRTADDTVKRLRRKLKEAGSQVLIETIWGYGFRLSLQQKGQN